MKPGACLESLKSAAGFLSERLGEAPPLAMVLGSGLGGFVEELDATHVPYAEIPHFPQSGVVGHAGVLSRIPEPRFCTLRGRVHLYEGLEMARIVFAVRALALWGVKAFVLTNAAGGVSEGLSPGDLMLIEDHLNLMGDNPLVGPNLDELGERFPDMSMVYDASLREVIAQSASEAGLELKRGVYVGLRGPSYETPAEIRMCRTLGADAVGMSTVPEAIALNHMGRRVAGISCITNMAAGIEAGKLDHGEVLEVTERVREKFSRLLLKVAERVNGNE